MLVGRRLWIVFGFVSLVLGAVGAVLPVLPTTPFVLLAAWCFARGSRRWLCWLECNRFFGGYLRDYRAGLGVPLSTKVVTLVVMWAGMGISAWWVHRIWVAVVLVVIGVGVTIHLCRLRTRRVMDDARSLSVGGESVGEGEKPEV